MTIKVRQLADTFIVVDTVTHRTLGKFTSKDKAERRRRYLNTQNRKQGKK